MLDCKCREMRIHDEIAVRLAATKQRRQKIRVDQDRLRRGPSI